MKNIRKGKGIFTVLLCICLLTGCGSSKEPYRIALVVKSTQTEYWKLVYKGAEAFAGSHNIDLELCGPEEESQQEEQKSIFEECVKEKDGIVLAATDYYLFEEPVKQAEVPVVLIDSEVKGDSWKSFVGTNNYEAGKILAEEFMERNEKKGKIAVISFVKNTGTAIERENGFLEEIRKNSEFEVLETQYCQSQVEKSYEITRSILEEDPDVNMVVGMNAQSLLGAARAAAEFSDRNIFLGGFDCLTEEVDYIEEGVVDVCILQNPYMMGYYGMENVWKVLEGQKVEKNVWVDTAVIDRDSVFEQKNQELIFPFTDGNE